MKNDFLEPSRFPRFDIITPEAADEAFPVLLKDSAAKVDAIEQTAAPEWAAVAALDEATRALWRAWGIVGHMTGVMNTPEWRAVEEKYQPDVIAFSLRISQSRKFYEIYKALATTEPDPVRRRIATEAAKSAERAGVALDGDKKKRFNEIQSRLAKLSNDFSNTVLDATKAFKLHIAPADEALLDGLPAHIKAMIADKEGGWNLTIEDAVYVPAMKHLKSSAIREKLYRARATRAPENTPRIPEILALRDELAKLLGYANFAEDSIDAKSAPSVKAVMDMIDEIGDAAKPARAKENDALEKFAGGKIALWDRAFYIERMREALYSYSEEELSKYFNFESVLKGLFDFAERMFGAKAEPADAEASVWHPDVRFFRLKDTSNGQTIAHFYLDPYSRSETKLGGAWMNSFDCLRRDAATGEKVLPLALLVCNQAHPDAAGRCLMTFREVETLFHEFGHALQHMLTRIEEEGASGLNLIEWDAVEVASQFMENWCADEHTLAAFAKHVETGERIPAELVGKVRAAKNYRAGADACRQLEFAKTDILLHSNAPGTPNEIKIAVTEEFSPGTLLPEDRFLESFTHIFAGGYAAGYYSYKWSEVMSADAFGAFEEAGTGDEEEMRRLGRKYRNTILANGGSKSAIDTFIEFRGRAPSAAALLRQQGLIE